MAKSPKPPKHKPLRILPEVIDAFNELDSADNRTAAIVGLALLENNLVLAILSRLREMTDAEQKDVFDDPLAPLSRFSAKIHLAWALNLFDEKVRSDLQKLNRIRNRFAHYLEVRDFDHSEVANLCDQLLCPQYLDPPPSKKTRPQTRREKYADTISHLAHRFALQTLQPHKPPLSLNRIGADY